MTDDEMTARIVACLKEEFEFWVSDVYLSERHWRDAAIAVQKVIAGEQTHDN